MHTHRNTHHHTTHLAPYRRLYKLTKYFSGAAGQEMRSAPLSVAEEGKHKVENFQEHLPLIASICNPGLRERHWQVRVGESERSGARGVRRKWVAAAAAAADGT